jgi:hypothetical protein
LIDAITGRDIATCDIPGAFMQSDMKGKVVMKLEGVMAEVIIKIDPKKYKKYIVKENRKERRHLRHPHQGALRHPSSRSPLLEESTKSTCAST